MGRASRRMRRRAARTMPEPTLREVAPGVYDLALPLPPGMPADEAAAAVEAFCATVRAELGLEIGPVRGLSP